MSMNADSTPCRHTRCKSAPKLSIRGSTSASAPLRWDVRAQAASAGHHRRPPLSPVTHHRPRSGRRQSDGAQEFGMRARKPRRVSATAAHFGLSHAPRRELPCRCGAATDVQSVRLGLRACHGSLPIRCWRGETGKRNRVALCWAQALVGSNPTASTAAQLTRQFRSRTLHQQSATPRSPFRYAKKSREALASRLFA